MDIVCFCHLRWNFVYQRPQQLLGRLTKKFRVFVVEEPVCDAKQPQLEIYYSKEKAWIITPHLPAGLDYHEEILQQQRLLKKLFTDFRIGKYIAWYYTPMAIELGWCLPAARLVVYDCMDELSAFKNAPKGLSEKENRLFRCADLVFTGGQSLYEAKKDLHSAVFAFPSSIDKRHFAKARTSLPAPFDQFRIPHPRIGFFGVLDERLDTELLSQVARLRPDWQFVMIGPVAKIDATTLPNAPNIHYTGSKAYEELPAYLAGWDVAMIPFIKNRSTQFISPTKTPEYLSGGVPVVSTSIRDVVSPYGEKNLVAIADTPTDFIKEIERSMHLRNNADWLRAIDDFLAGDSWDITCERMLMLIMEKLHSPALGTTESKPSENRSPAGPLVPEI